MLPGAWSDGKFYYRNNNEGPTMKAMVEAARTNPEIAQRVRMFRYRALEEFYDLRKDPDCLANLVDKPEHKGDVERLQSRLRDWMKQTRDPLLEAFECRYSPDRCRAVLVKVYGENYTQAAQQQQRASKAVDE